MDEQRVANVCIHEVERYRRGPAFERYDRCARIGVDRDYRARDGAVTTELAGV